MTEPTSDDAKERARAQGARWPLYLLVLPFIGTLCVPLYNRIEPTLGGVPFFYWYQFLWIAIGASLTALAYFATSGAPRK
jgi:hypothetical protein